MKEEHKVILINFALLAAFDAVTLAVWWLSQPVAAPYTYPLF